MKSAFHSGLESSLFITTIQHAAFASTIYLYYTFFTPSFPPLTSLYISETSLKPIPGDGNVKTLLWCRKKKGQHAAAAAVSYFITISPPENKIIKSRLPKNSTLAPNLLSLTGYSPGTLPCFIPLKIPCKTVYIDSSLREVDIFGGSGVKNYSIEYSVEHVHGVGVGTAAKHPQPKPVYLGESVSKSRSSSIHFRA